MGSKSYLNSRNKLCYARLMRNKTFRVLIVLTIFVAVYFWYFNTPQSLASIPLEESQHLRFTPLPTTKFSTTKARVKSRSKIRLKTRFLSTQPMKPVRLSPLKLPFVNYPTIDLQCRMVSCFNHTRCSLSGGFPIYLYALELLSSKLSFTTGALRDFLGVDNVFTTDPDESCIYFALVGEMGYNDYNHNVEAITLKLSSDATIRSLPYWRRGGGRNHVILNVAQKEVSEAIGYAILAQTTFTHKRFRPGYDVIVPPAIGPVSGDVWALIPPMVPARRKYLLSFQGVPSVAMSHNTRIEGIAKAIHQMVKTEYNTSFYVKFHCQYVDRLHDLTIRDWALCDKRKTRKEILEQSTFVLILPPIDTAYVSTHLLQTRLYEALESGAIPVIIGGDKVRLPYEEVLDWRKAVISLTTAHVTELHLLLKTISNEDILAFRRQGRLFWERYLGTVHTAVDSLLGIIRNRLNIPAKPSSLYKAKSPKTELSLSFKRNFTVGLVNGYEQWNVWGDPFILHSRLPWDPVLTPEARFTDPSLAGRFQKTCKDLTGNRPVEEFTVVILTYKRTDMLADALNRLSGMPYLNKIVVVTNGVKPPSTSWPNTVPIEVFQEKKNSLNNRFLPHHLIETEAVFCMDDDVIPNQEKLLFAFKVWRDNRDQIVGFFGRNYYWDYKQAGFLYSTKFKKKKGLDVKYQVTCDVSMILTGAAFIHRYFFVTYWRILPPGTAYRYLQNIDTLKKISIAESITEIYSPFEQYPNVTKYPRGHSLNNGKRPKKTRNKKYMKGKDTDWTTSVEIKAAYKKLSNEKSHYFDRDKCMQYFIKVMGYNPLLTTQFQATTYQNKSKSTWQSI